MTFGGKDSGPIGYNETNFNTWTFNGNQADPANDPALNLQAALRKLDPALADVTVDASDADTFLINFGAASGGLPYGLLGVGNTSLSGFLPAVNVTMVREPGTTVVIPVSQTDPSVTAANIEYAFQQPSVTAAAVTGYPTGATNFNIAPIVFSPDTLHPYGTPDTMRTALPAVSVTCASPRSSTLPLPATWAWTSSRC